MHEPFNIMIIIYQLSIQTNRYKKMSSNFLKGMLYHNSMKTFHFQKEIKRQLDFEIQMYGNNK